MLTKFVMHCTSGPASTALLKMSSAAALCAADMLAAAAAVASLSVRRHCSCERSDYCRRVYCHCSQMLLKLCWPEQSARKVSLICSRLGAPSTMGWGISAYTEALLAACQSG